MATRVWEMGFLMAFVACRLMLVEPISVSEPPVCSLISLPGLILQSHDSCLGSGFVLDSASGKGSVGVTEVDEVSLQRALYLLRNDSSLYVSMLFYASWCPFSKTCRPTFAILSSSFPAIRHFAIEESANRPSMLLRYGVHGFPTLFLQNSTTRIHYHGSRTLNSLVAFYKDVTGIEPAALDPAALEKIADSSNLAKHEEIEQENCPFSWARSPEKLLRQETYLALATSFLLLRLLCFFLPPLLAHAKQAWRRHVHNMSAASFREQPQACLGQAMRILSRLKPCKRRNLQEGALNATAWASKSLASVSIGEGSSSSVRSASERR